MWKKYLISSCLSLAILFAILSGCGLSGTYINNVGLRTDDIAGQHTGSLYLIGDCGAPSATRPEPAFEGLKEQLQKDTSATKTVVFLGDNIYSAGLSKKGSKSRAEEERRLRLQVEAANLPGVRVFFIPGNHDWYNSRGDGLAAIRRQGEFLSSFGENIALVPEGGCPGPSVLDISPDLRLIAIDTQWWLHGFTRPEGSECATFAQEDTLIAAYAAAIASSPTPNIVVVGHHPIRSNGSHGGFFDWKAHIFPFRIIHKNAWVPLPFIGSLYPLLRMVGITNQDFSGRKYQRLISRFDSLFAQYPPLVYASGHEHAQQIFLENNTFHVVTGNGILKHSEEITTSPKMLLGSTRPGFVRLRFFGQQGSDLTTFIVADDNISTDSTMTFLLR